jgi:rubrerythrin
MRESFIFYRSFIQAIDDQPPDNFKKIIKAAASYALDGITPESMDGPLKMAFNFMKPLIDSNNAKWEVTRKKRSESGKKGGLAKQANARNAKKNLANLANQAVNVNVDEDVNVNEDVDVTTDTLSENETPKPTTTINSQLIQEIAKSQGFFITTKQAKDFHCLDPTWLAGDFNFIVFAAEKISSDKNKEHSDHERIFIKAWSYQNLVQEYPVWFKKKKAEAHALERNRQRAEAEQERQRALSAVKNNKNKTCTNCGTAFEDIDVPGSCPSCGWSYSLDEEKMAFVFCEHKSLSEAFDNMLRDKYGNATEIPSEDIEF